MGNVWGNFYSASDTMGHWASASTTNTFQIVQTWPTPEAVPEPEKGEPDPLEWLRERVEEICDLSGIAA